jgi:hypothetical protein
MEYPYPKDFPNSSRSRVRGARTRASRAFEEARGKAHGSSDSADLLRGYILSVLLAYVREAGDLIRQGSLNWSIDYLESEAREFLRRFTIFARQEKGGTQFPEMVSNLDGRVLAAAQREFEKSSLWREYEDFLLALSEATSTAVDHARVPDERLSAQAMVTDPPGVPLDWEDVEISFISDERVNTMCGTETQTCNYAEMGFRDKRSGKPNQAWVLLRAFAEAKGVMPEASRSGKEFLAVEKRFERLRQALKKHFQIDSDPILRGPVCSYRCRFKIGCGPSFEK